MSDPDQPYGAIPPAGSPPPGPPPPGTPPPPPGFPPPGFPPAAGAGGPSYPGGPLHPGGPGGPTGSRRGNGLWIALGVVGVLALVGVVVTLVLLLTGEDDDRSGSDDTASGPAPDEVVQGLIDAAGEDDCDRAKTFLTESAQQAEPCSSAEFRLLSTEDVDSEVGEPSVDGETATVPVGFTSSEGGSDYLFRLEQVDDEWKVASYALDTDATDDATASTDGPTASVDDPTESPTDGSTDGPTDDATSGSPGGTSTADAVADDPEAVVEAFFGSVVGGDCATAEDLVTDAYLREEGDCDTSMIPTELEDQVTYDVGTAKVDAAAGTATVPVEVSFSGQKETAKVGLVQENGKWRVNEVG